MVSVIDSVGVLAELVRAMPLGVVATVDPAGKPEAALVSFAVTASGDLLFDSRSDARKIANIAADPRVALVLGCSGVLSVQVEGVAVIESGAAREAAGREYDAQFPGSHALADGFSLVRVRPCWVRHYDAGVDPARVVEGPPAWGAAGA